MNPNEELHRTRLSKAIETSYRALEPFRHLTRGLVEEYAGSGYGRPGRARPETVLNLSNQTVNAYLMALVANSPRFQIFSKLEERKFFCQKFQTALNNLVQEIDLESTMRRWVLDAYFCVGIVKTHMAESGYVQLEVDRWIDPGMPFASSVSIDNWVHDMTATRWDAVQFAGDSYRIPFTDLDHPAFDPEVVAEILPTSKNSVEQERLERMTRGEVVDDDELEPMIDLADIWVPRDGKIYTFPIERRGQFLIKSRPIADMDWDGDELGPYHLLSFDDVPENIMPASVAAHTAALERLANSLLRKQKRQANRQKEVTTYSAAAASDAQKVQREDDGGMVMVNNPDEIRTLKFGGVDPGNMAFLMNVLELQNRAAGNISAIAGLGPQAPTASQEQIIQGNVNDKVAQMQLRVRRATNRLGRALAKMLWDDKAKVIPGTIPIEGAEMYSLDATWTPDDREGSFFDYETEIDVYSMTSQSPQQRIQTIQQLLTQFYIPLAAQMSAQGIQINFQEFTNMVAEMLNLPQLKQVIQYVMPMGEEAGGEEVGPPSATKRTYERRSVSAGPTPQNKARMDAASWMQMAAQPGA